ncbi:membrane protein [Pseudoclavibacter endophyticus]|uniref:HlyC/CorC family transporter n=1 Tax=Pseudoclavibacter endophyticus TaxID=1778590 RepID=A0A6H9WR39_9MICO|nr:hemolysin family protein [Pseudoclavibacter endophyticus]KAB1648790.1 HlyC/CorC family transporter [Pseudoclavibacter endophyticus]GGA68491.1 membrane protein [Pseudoclavibacter endophyticus]
MIEALLTLLLGAIAILAIIAVNGYFVAQEFAYMSVNRTRLSAQAKAGDAAAERALRVTRRTSFMLSGAQLGITVTGLMVGYVAEPLIGESLGELLGDVGVPPAVSISVGTVLALVVATVVQMLFGELYPKNLAIANPEPLARSLARSTLVYLTVFGWLIAVFDRAANALLQLLRIEPIHDVDTSATREDLKHAIADSRESGDLPADLSLLIERVLEFPERDVEHATIPRARVDVIPADATVNDVRERMARGHSRYPVVDSSGQPVGVVELSSLLREHHPDDAPVQSIMREPLLVPTLMPLPAVLGEFAETGDQLACVIDEYGGFAGILTLEDLAEELVGEITDEHDPQPAPFAEAVDEVTWIVDGDLAVDEAARVIGHALPEGDYETVAGMVIAHLGALLDVGDRTSVPLPEDPSESTLTGPQHRRLDVEALAVQHHVPSSLRITLAEGQHDGPERPIADRHGNGRGQR